MGAVGLDWAYGCCAKGTDVEAAAAAANREDGRGDTSTLLSESWITISIGAAAGFPNDVGPFKCSSSLLQRFECVRLPLGCITDSGDWRNSHDEGDERGTSSSYFRSSLRVALGDSVRVPLDALALAIRIPMSWSDSQFEFELESELEWEGLEYSLDRLAMDACRNLNGTGDGRRSESESESESTQTLL